MHSSSSNSSSTTTSNSNNNTASCRGEYICVCVSVSEQRLALIWGCRCRRFKSYWLRLSHLLSVFVCVCLCVCLLAFSSPHIFNLQIVGLEELMEIILKVLVQVTTQLAGWMTWPKTFITKLNCRCESCAGSINKYIQFVSHLWRFVRLASVESHRISQKVKYAEYTQVNIQYTGKNKRA